MVVSRGTVSSVRRPQKDKYVFNNLAAVANEQFVRRVQKILAYHGYDPSDTVLGTSFCSARVNRPLENEFAKIFGNHFSLGGLAGFPLGGVTAFREMASAIPTNGSCLLVYGPHLAVDEDGVVDETREDGVQRCTCSTRAAKNVIRVMLRKHEPGRQIEDKRRDQLVRKTTKSLSGGKPTKRANADGTGEKEEPDKEMELPLEENFDLKMIDQTLMPHGRRFIEQTEDPTVELAMAMFDAQDELMQNILAEACSSIERGSRIALLGGVQINTPEGLPDYFMPLKFELRDHEGQLLENLLWRDSRKARKTPQTTSKRRRKKLD